MGPSDSCGACRSPHHLQASCPPDGRGASGVGCRDEARICWRKRPTRDGLKLPNWRKDCQRLSLPAGSRVGLHGQACFVRETAVKVSVIIPAWGDTPYLKGSSRVLFRLIRNWETLCDHGLAFCIRQFWTKGARG